MRDLVPSSSRVLMAIVLAASAAACRNREAARGPVVVRNPEYLVVRTLTREEDRDHKMRVDLPYSGAGYAFASAAPLLDLNSFVLADARLAGGSEDLGGTVAIWMPLKPEGSRALEAWSTSHTGERLGVFLRGKLVEAPQVQSGMGIGIPLQVPSKAEADRVLKELARGGATE